LSAHLLGIEIHGSGRCPELSVSGFLWTLISYGGFKFIEMVVRSRDRDQEQDSALRTIGFSFPRLAGALRLQRTLSLM
jgi:hypothetical protein